MPVSVTSGTGGLRYDRCGAAEAKLRAAKARDAKRRAVGVPRAPLPEALCVAVGGHAVASHRRDDAGRALLRRRRAAGARTVRLRKRASGYGQARSPRFRRWRRRTIRGGSASVRGGAGFERRVAMPGSVLAPRVQQVDAAHARIAPGWRDRRPIRIAGHHAGVRTRRLARRRASHGEEDANVHREASVNTRSVHGAIPLQDGGRARPGPRASA
jgi:hypothetical protein